MEAAEGKVALGRQKYASFADLSSFMRQNNYDGVACHAMIERQQRAERIHHLVRMSTPIWIGTASISLYNLSRMGNLSGSGRIAALGGLCMSGLFLAESLSK